MSHEEYVHEQKARVVSIATSMLNGEIGIIAGARQLAALQAEVSDQQFDPDFLIFFVISSETDGLPVGPAREYWAASALVEMDREVQQAEELYRQDAFASCMALVERFRAP